MVGAYVAKFVLFLRDNFQVGPEHVHVIGHSLGAHAAGYAGAAIKEAGGVLGRITGLDPAGPYFTNMPEVVRLDPSDAAYVDTVKLLLSHF